MMSKTVSNPKEPAAVRPLWLRAVTSVAGRWFAATGLLVAVLSVLDVVGLSLAGLGTDIPLAESGTFEGIYEPSGVTQLGDGSLLVIEDEPLRPFWLLKPDAESRSFRGDALRPGSGLSMITGRINDLEGLASGEAGFVYAVTSHSRQKGGKRKREREKLMRFKVKGGRMESLTTRSDLRAGLVRAFPILEDSARERRVKRKGGLNIEGLASAPEGGRLLLGFRAPLFEDQALIVALINPQNALEKGEAFRFEDAPVLLDLDGGGIRDLTFSSRLGGYLILSQRDAKEEKHFKLWLWNGRPVEPPRRVSIKGISHLGRAEGIATIVLGGDAGILLVNDDGIREKRRGATYLLVEYTDLRIEEAGS